MALDTSPQMAGIDSTKLLEMYEKMVQIRIFEDLAGKNFADGIVPGFVHLYAGEEAVAVGARVFWVQLGLWSDAAADIAWRGGLDVVMNRCLKIEHARFAGGLHLAGFDTGVLDSRRQKLV